MGTMPAATDGPVARCLYLLHALALAGRDLVERLRDRVDHHRESGAGYRLLAAAYRRCRRISRALGYADTLIAKLLADPSYRGEPALLRKEALSVHENLLTGDERFDWERAQRLPGRRPRSFESLFAGKSISQIIERIRRDMGLHTPLGPWVDTILTEPQPDPSPPPLITLTHKIWRAINVPEPGSPRARTATSKGPSTGPP